jgi:glycosyltransferase involved in cell wall biosynthesis
LIPTLPFEPSAKTTNQTPAMDSSRSDLEITILMPCLNEAETIARCVGKAVEFLRQSGIDGEVLVADNGSTDGSQVLAANAGARVVDVAEKGYGAALRGGIEAARGRFVIMGDADDSYDFSALNVFVDKLRAGHDLVMGNRFAGGIEQRAMPALHRYLGNPVLSFIGRLLFRAKVNDFHCGLRGFRRSAILELGLNTSGMEFASEMVVKASLNRLRITEVPTTLSRDGRSRPPHLRSWRDGWRHLRFLLLFSPRWLFLYPGFLLMLAGFLAMITLFPGPMTIGTLTLDIHTMLYASLAMITGLQLIQFAVFSRAFAARIGVLPPSADVARLTGYLSLERGMLLGFLLLLAGLIGSSYAVASWGHSAFGPMDPSSLMRLAIPSATAIATGLQTIFGSFFLGILGIRGGETT